MGLKSGSAGTGLDDSDQSDDTPVNESTRGAEAEANETTNENSVASDLEQINDDSDDRISKNSLPYILRRNKVNEDREQIPIFLREHVIEGESDLERELEDLLDENVWTSDYREAAMVLAQRNPHRIADILREWGYDLK